MQLPDRFKLEIADLWQELDPPGTLPQFLAALDEPSGGGLRVNTLKIQPNEWLSQQADPANFKQVYWCPTGFYYPAEFSPGKQSDYFAGLYYIQEPSAMLPAEILNPQSGDKVLDLCAAPGGKSTRLAEMCSPEGLLWANEISSERVKALLRNLELMGVDRSVISNETPKRLADSLPEYFDRILVDAPCSGSGMFRRDPQATTSWEKYGPEACVLIQRDILESADQMLKPGGFLVYSTCSFSVSEDEKMIQEFLDNHINYHVVPINRSESVSPGLDLDHRFILTSRIWPHIAQGDGHFCALLQKKSVAVAKDNGSERSLPPVKYEADPRISLYQEWLNDVLSEPGQIKMKMRESKSYYRTHQDHLHLVPNLIPNLSNLHYVKTGLYLGEFRTANVKDPAGSSRAVQMRNAQAGQSKKYKIPTQNNQSWRFEPAHAFLLTLTADDFRYCFRLNRNDPTIMRYLRGETITWLEQDWPAEGWPTGAWVAICLGNNPLGWAKAGQPGQLKNNYPPGWRKMN